MPLTVQPLWFPPRRRIGSEKTVKKLIKFFRQGVAAFRKQPDKNYAEKKCRICKKYQQRDTHQNSQCILDSCQHERKRMLTDRYQTLGNYVVQGPNPTVVPVKLGYPPPWHCNSFPGKPLPATRWKPSDSSVQYLNMQNEAARSRHACKQLLIWAARAGDNYWPVPKTRLSSEISFFLRAAVAPG